MSGSGESRGAPLPRATRAALVARLRAQLPEIETAVFKRVRSLGGKPEAEDPQYLSGLRAAVIEAVEYGLTGIEQGEESGSESIPPAAAAQARRAARNGVKLETVLRRYAAGDRALGDFILSQEGQFPGEILRQVLREQGPRIDHLMSAVATEYMHESEQIRRSPTRRMVERIERLLADDEFATFDGLDYEANGWHLGMIVKGAGADETVRAAASALERKPLSVPGRDGAVWAWLGGRDPVSASDIKLAFTEIPEGVCVAIGEPRWGPDGWRLTHHEAQAALLVMGHRPQRLVRSSDKILLAAVFRDEQAVESLRETYLRPLDELGEPGAKLCRTLQSYIATGFNAESTSAALGIDRSTVQRHLRKIEELLGQHLHHCHAELKIALELRELIGQSGATG